MVRITSVRAEAGWQLHVVFSDGLTSKVQMESRLFGPMFEPLRDPALFGQVFVDEFGAVCWPNGADLAPDALYARARATEAVGEVA